MTGSHATQLAELLDLIATPIRGPDDRAEELASTAAATTFLSATLALTGSRTVAGLMFATAVVFAVSSRRSRPSVARRPPEDTP